jgi:hypothetical protein
MLPTYANLYRLNLMACNKPEHLRCPKCKRESEDQSTKAFREANESNPSRLEARVYDV